MKLATISTIQTGERVITTARYALTIEREHDDETLFMLGLIDRATGAHIDSGIGYDSLASVAGFLRSYLDRETLADMLDSLASGAEVNRRGLTVSGATATGAETSARLSYAKPARIISFDLWRR